ncbi:MAG: UvrB/UvrC motif-containing protein [Oscillospiraceae bacterium]
MKCSKCGNDATFHYQSNVNGEKSEYHLCAECAEAEGFGEMLNYRPQSMFNDFFREPFGGLMSGFFGSPFGRLSEGFFPRSVMAETMTLPEVRVFIGDPEKTTSSEGKSADNIPEDAGEDIRSRRELHALKNQLKAAIKAEEFEKAAELRDEIHRLEK